MAYPNQQTPTYIIQQPAGVNQTVIIQNPPQQTVYVNQQKSYSQRIAGNVGSVLGQAIRSSGELVRDSRSVGHQVGKSAAQAAKSSAQLAGHAAKGFVDEMDRTAKTPLLDCFYPGSGIQLVSKSGGGCLRCLPDGRIDGRGVIGTDYSCHWLVVNRWENKVTLRNGAFANCMLAMQNDGFASTTGVGSNPSTSTFKLHETSNHYLRLEHALTSKIILLNNAQNVAQQIVLQDDALFEVHIAYSPIGHVYKPVH